MINKTLKTIDLHKYIQIFILIADLSLFVRIGILNKYVLPPYGIPLFELFIIIALIILCINFYINGFNENIKLILKKYGLYLLLIGVFLLIGTILGEIIYKPSMDTLVPTIKGLLLFVIASVSFILHAYYANSQKFREKVLFSMSFVIILSIFILIPSFAEKLRILGDSNNSLIGFSRNQNILGILLLIPLIIFLKEMFEKISWKLILNWVLFIITFSLILWTGSRGTLVASALMILVFTLFQVYSITTISSYKRFSKIIHMGILVIVSIAISFSILPSYIKLMAIDRIYPVITDYKPTPEKFKNLKLQDALHKNNTENVLLLKNIPYQNRQNIWPKAISLLVKNPGGIGPEYARFAKAIFETNNNWTVSHNTMLQTTLSGGFVLLLLIIIAIGHIIKIIFRMPISKEKYMFLALWVGFLVAIQFNDFLFNIPWIWAIAGLIVGKSIETTSSND